MDTMFCQEISFQTVEDVHVFLFIFKVAGLDRQFLFILA